MLQRRNFLQLAAAAPLFVLGQPAFPLWANDLEAEIKAWVNDSQNRGYFDPPKASETQKGSLILAPTDPSVKQAVSILQKVPASEKPVETARWMMNNIPKSFSMEWPPDTPAHKMPANPLIIEFFAATKTAPYKGDETAWCAAFMCWVLMKCGKPYTKDAGSRSFRNFAPIPKVDEPAQGDIVVFHHLSNNALGHVAFFDGYPNLADKTKIWCLGGNQGNAISRKQFTTNKGDLRLHSYHRIS